MLTAIHSKVVQVDDDVLGLRWKVTDLAELAKLIAVIALGQSEHAARIISELEPHGPALSDVDLYAGARSQMRIKGSTETQKEVSMYHRDGFLFECISWIVALQSVNPRTFLKDPHISATTQGLDGLMIELDPVTPVVLNSTIFEDKCTEHPRTKFRDEVMQTFTEHHASSKRNRELVANAIQLIQRGGLNGTEAARAAAGVLDKTKRSYRAALTVGPDINSATKRSKLFKNYNSLAGIAQANRIGATFVVDGDLRGWFQELADQVIRTLNEFEADDV